MSRWTVRLTDPAERDFARILAWTADNFGDRQARVYEQTLTAALDALKAGPDVRGSAARDDVQAGLRVLHVSRSGRRGRHLLVYREAPGHMVAVLRILHDMMELELHFPEA